MDKKHNCRMPNSSEEYRCGPAIEYCLEYDDEDILFAGNGEYESQVNYCPICGYKAKIQIKEEKK